MKPNTTGLTIKQIEDIIVSLQINIDKHAAKEEYFKLSQAREELYIWTKLLQQARKEVNKNGRKEITG